MAKILKSEMLDIYVRKYFGEFLDDDNINEIAYNGGNLIWTEDINGNWESHESILNFDEALAFANTSAVYKNDTISEQKPILSCILSTGERVQIVIPNATKEGYISITIRKPSKAQYDIEDYIKNGSIDAEFAQMLKSAIQNGKNIIICGETGSGKTTFMKTLIDFIPLDERIVTIEDVEEIKFYKHKNFVQLFYPSEAKSSDAVNATSLLKSCLRMKPSRILLAEVRGGETYDFLNVISSGHNGSMTSCHAGSVKSTVDRLVMMSMQNDQAKVLGKDMLLDIIKNTIDCIIVFRRQGGKRLVTEYQNGEKRYIRKDDGKFYEI
ncbi:MAG: Flp pilus assembly complex ATPase component TadA [Campylobacter sp.]|nr:Flp pilus assembly complex ATPase component TadA [Campylobacter sp.]